MISDPIQSNIRESMWPDAFFECTVAYLIIQRALQFQNALNYTVYCMIEGLSKVIFNKFILERRPECST